MWRLNNVGLSARRRRPRQRPNARAKLKLETPRQLIKRPKWASEKPHQVPIQIPSADDVLVVIKVVRKTRWLHQRIHPKCQCAAAQLGYPPDTINTSCLSTPSNHDSKKSVDSSYCGCCYSLIFVVVIMLFGGRKPFPGMPRTGTVRIISVCLRTSHYPSFI